MATVEFRTSDDTLESVEVLPGLTVMEAAVQHDIAGIEGVCGGAGICGTCHVVVDAPWMARLPAANSTEISILETLPNRQANSRLSCQIKMSDALHGMVLRAVPADQ
ncbi:MAG: 2Fe-2S iron-sulfur cluster-binding protein [Steroidobacteraceae bacterium]